MSKTYISKALRAKVSANAKYRCGYCLSQEFIIGTPLEIEHIIPETKGGLTVEKNLWLACRQCNDIKNDRTHAKDPISDETVLIFNPSEQTWDEHFVWEKEGEIIIGLTPIGRATVVALKLNRSPLVTSRTYWIQAGWHPPKD
jgi:HNH endonuclease